MQGVDVSGKLWKVFRGQHPAGGIFIEEGIARLAIVQFYKGKG